MRRLPRAMRRGALAWLLGALLALARAFDAAAQAVPGTAAGSQTGDGGGAWTTLASAPEANLFTGVAQASVPIEVPPGRQAAAPALALAWSSNAGPGPIGYGWSLPIPRVHRSLRGGLPHYNDRDSFVLEMPGGAMDLVRVPGSRRGFRAEVEGGFLRIGFDEASNCWKAIDKLGTSFVFGTSPASRTGRDSGRDGTFAWLLERVEDAAGNRIDFAWRGGGPSGTSNGQPERVAYGANSATASPHFAEVLFHWEALPHQHARPASWREGHPESWSERLASIETRTHGLPARRYVLSHREDPVTTDLLLVGVTLTAFAERSSDDVTMPSTVFAYAPAVPRGWNADGALSEAPSPWEIPAAGILHQGGRTLVLDSADVDGNAIPDRVDATSWPPALVPGNGRSFEAPRPWNWPSGPGAPRAVRRSDGSGNLLSNVFDLDGDGLADLVDASAASCGAAAGNWCVWRGSGERFASSAAPWPAPTAQLRTARDAGAKVLADLVDMDGDGRVDLLDAGAWNAATHPWWDLYRNTGSGFAPVAERFAAPSRWIARRDGMRLVEGLLDLNGDGLADLVSTDFGSGVVWSGTEPWRAWMNEGTGFAKQPFAWAVEAAGGGGPGLPNFLSLQAKDGSTLADVFDLTGDGRPDLVRRWRLADPLGEGAPESCRPSSRCPTPGPYDAATSPGSCCFPLLLYANTGHSFSRPVGWSSPAHGLRSSLAQCPYDWFSCRAALLYDFDYFDVDGDGLADFVERNTAGGHPWAWLVHPHPASARSGGTRPNLLVAMRNGMGGETLLRYGTASADPASRLPFAHWVLRERIVSSEDASTPPLRTSYAYSGGLFDGATREVRGFAKVQETDPAGLVHLHEFHQDHRRAGRLRSLSHLARAACADAEGCDPWRGLLSSTTWQWPDEGPVLVFSERDVPFHDGRPVEALAVTTTYTHDEYGNVTSRRVETPLAAATTTTTTFVHRVADAPDGMPLGYSVGKPSASRMMDDGAATPLVEKTYRYAPGTSGLPARMLLEQASTCIAWTGASCSRWSTRSFQYDAFSNFASGTEPTGGQSVTTWDAEGLFPVRTVDAGGLVTQAVTEPRGGKVIATVTPGGVTLRTRYDGLGRVLRSWGPGTSEEAPLRRMDYAPGSLGSGPLRVVTRDAGAPVRVTFFDGLGRVRATTAASAGPDGPVVVVSGLKAMDERGLVVAEALPFERPGSAVEDLPETIDDAPALLRYQHDEAARRIEATGPDGASTRSDPSAPGILVSQDANLRATGNGSVTIETFDGLSRRILRERCAAEPLAGAPYECPPGSLLRREWWTYDGLGRVLEARTAGLGVAAGDSVATTVRDGLGNPVESAQSDAGTWRFAHDEAGRLVQVEPPDGRRVAIRYDAAGRILQRRGPDHVATYRYETRGAGIGKVARVITRSRGTRIEEDFSHDARGRVATRRRRITVAGGRSAEVEVRYGYDDLDRRTSVQVPQWPVAADNTLMRRYDELGREVRTWSGATVHVAEAGYDPMGRLLRVVHDNGLVDLAWHEAPSSAAARAGYLRCTRVTTTAAAATGACAVDAADLDARRYSAYDAAGNLLAVEDLRWPAGDPRREDLRFSYDALGRLREASSGAVRQAFAFDPLGNLTLAGDVAIAFRDPAHPGQATEVVEAGGPRRSLAYDAAGRRIADGERSFEWDDDGSLRAVRAGGVLVSEHAANDSGERVWSRDAATGRSSFEMGDGIRIVGGTIERTVFLGERPVSIERRPLAGSNGSAELLFLHVDHQQSLRLVTDAAGRAVQHLRYAPFGLRTALLDGRGLPATIPASRLAYTAHLEDAAAGLLHFGSRDYDPTTGSFLSLDPRMQFPSPYAYSHGNPLAGRDADGGLFGAAALEVLALLTGTAGFVDSIVRSGDLGHSLTAGVFAGFSVYASAQLSSVLIHPLAQQAPLWLQRAAAVATDGFQGMQAAAAFEDGRYAGGVVAAGMLAASLVGIEEASDPGPGSNSQEQRSRHGITDRGVVDGRRTIDVDGICSTRPGCVSNTLVAARENIRVLLGGRAACVGGCEHVAEVASDYLSAGQDVRLRCNSFGAIKCLGAIQQKGLDGALAASGRPGAATLTVEMSGAPLLRPPAMRGVTYPVNLFDPVVWVGTAWSTPVRSDVLLGRNWWVPAPVIVHHSRMYERPFLEALGDMLP